MKGKVTAMGLVSQAGELLDAAAELITSQLSKGKMSWTDVDRFEAYYALTMIDIRSMYAVKEGYQLAAIITGNVGRTRRLVDLAHEHRAGTKNAWVSAARRYPAKAFTIWLAARTLGSTTGLPQSGVFAELVKDWKKPAELRAIADWRLRMLGSINVGFDHYALVPVDLAAIRKVRDAEGLATIWPDDHPLVTNPAAKAWLARPKSTWSPKKDPHFPAIVRAVKQAGLLPTWFDPNKP